MTAELVRQQKKKKGHRICKFIQLLSQIYAFDTKNVQLALKWKCSSLLKLQLLPYHKKINSLTQGLHVEFR